MTSRPETDATRASLSTVAALMAAVVLVVAAPVAASGAAPASTTQVAQARSLTASEAAGLAEAAVDDDAALDDLRQVTEVDGRPVDLDAALAGVDRLAPAERAARLDALAATWGSTDTQPGDPAPDETIDPDDARDQAREVLDDDKYHERELPRPLAGPLGWLADRFRWMGDGLDAVLGPVGRALGRLPGGRLIIWLGLTAIIGGVIAWMVHRASRAAIDGRTHRGLVDPAADPADLDRQADEAEAGGELSAAIRLRYEAGLIRLVRADRLRLEPRTTPADAADQVGGEPMGVLTRDFEEIVYGDRPATAADLERSRRAWPEILGARSDR